MIESWLHMNLSMEGLFIECGNVVRRDMTGAGIKKCDPGPAHLTGLSPAGVSRLLGRRPHFREMLGQAFQRLFGPFQCAEFLHREVALLR